MAKLNSIEATFQNKSEKSADFSAWFDGSKVIDQNGAPLMVFHTTRYEFDVADFWPLSHFGTAEAANDIAVVLNVSKGFGSQPPPIRTIPVFLNIKNPIEMTDLWIHGWKGYRDEFRLQKENLKMTEDDITECFGVDLDPKEGWRPRMIEILKSRGYDGIKYMNDVEDAGSDAFIIFDSDQVRSALDIDARSKDHSVYLSKKVTQPGRPSSVQHTL